MAEDRMLSDEVLLALINKNSGGGGGGTDDYNDLSNQPQINNNTLVGNKTASDLGLVAAEAGKGLSTNDYTDADKAIVGGVTAALAGKQGALTAGKYIDIDANNEISVDPVVPNESFTYLIEEPADYTLHVTKSVDGVVVFEETYVATTWDAPIDVTLDNAIRIYTSLTGTMFYELIIASDTHDAGFKQTISWYGRDTFTENFSTVDHSGEKLITKSDMDAALAGKQGVLTAGNYVSIADDGTIKVTQSIGVYDVYSYEFMSIGVGTQIQLTKKINNVTISTQDIRNEDYSPTNKLTVDGLFELWYDMSNFYWHYKLLVDSNEHQKYEDINWYYRTMADYTETFNVSQDSSTDLVVRSELNAVSEKLPAVPTTDGTYILTATVTNGEVVYSWESNNGLTQEQINALIALLN